ncbi:MAG: Hsp33 family molecular chaperone HslO [Holophagales bacterium]|nr:Hsp33 family molecular chaperone HslO [Holophagales bacterium]
MGDERNSANSVNSALVVRALTGDGQIRMSAIDATPLWDGVRRGHPHLEADSCGPLTELLAGATLLQSRSLLTERVQLAVRSSGRAKAIVADSWPNGSIRGILDLNPACTNGQWLAFPGLFQVMRSNPKGQPYIGNLELVDGPISAQLEYYLQQSEQIQACVALWCDTASGAAGGVLVEPLPNCPPGRIKRMVAGIEGLEVTQLWERTPEFLVSWINQGSGAEVLSMQTIEYRCRCSKESLIDILGTMPRNERENIFANGKATVNCEYCGKSYEIGPEEMPDTDNSSGLSTESTP